MIQDVPRPNPSATAATILPKQCDCSFGHLELHHCYISTTVQSAKSHGRCCEICQVDSSLALPRGSWSLVTMVG